MTKKKEKQCEGCGCEIRVMSSEEHDEFIADIRALFNKYGNRDIEVTHIYGGMISIAVAQYLLTFDDHRLEAIQNINTSVCYGIDLFKEFLKFKEQSND